MPVSSSQIKTLLDQKRAAFSVFSRTKGELLQAYNRAWIEFAALPHGQQLAQFDHHPGPVGARPLEAIVTEGGADKGIFPFFFAESGPVGDRWTNREQSTQWVQTVLQDITTFAVDGSQISPGKDISIPIALLQIGWFENPHSATRPYQKDVRVDLMTPAELGPNPAQPVERRVNIRRFQMEVARLVEYINACPEPERTLVFFDGALVVTFAEAFDSESQTAYVQSILSLLEASDRRRVPLVGYVDTSYAHDLTGMLHHAYGLEATEGIHDAQLLAPLMKWGDRTAVFQCDRGGILDQYDTYADQIAFTYLKTTRDGYPARLEMPRWMWATGQMSQYLNWVRGEVIVGGGYPYSIETADQTAVLQGQDKHLFLRVLQDWAEREAINLRLSRKMVSKQRRR
ncbi:MAG: DNA double-strand break repair nuclease NurA [Leptolyngbya sp. DLM2.Bin27]|nr:MAG: DNA double-strand break repair nuclease NurA [Leptolyngbya sp. DLM2.Bin27]